MKNQDLFSSKDKSKKKIKCRLLQFLFGAFRANMSFEIKSQALHPWFVPQMIQICPETSYPLNLQF